MFFINYVFVPQPEVAGAAFISLSALRRYVRKSRTIQRNTGYKLRNFYAFFRFFVFLSKDLAILSPLMLYCGYSLFHKNIVV